MAGEYPRLRDQQVAADVRDAIDRDRVLHDTYFEFAVRGGVVHALLDPTNAEDADELRRVVSRVRGVHATWLRITAPWFRCIDIGCGGAKQVEGAVGLDVERAPAADVLADLERGLPFADNSVDCVFAVHVLEHVHNLPVLLRELHRVLKPNGRLHVMVPFASHINAIADPTHLRFFHPQTFKYICRPPSGTPCWYPDLVTCDGASVFADLRPLPVGESPPDAQLARFFD